MELHSGPLPPPPPPHSSVISTAYPTCDTVTRQHPPPRPQSAVKQLFGELRSLGIKLLAGKTEESHLANWLRKRMTNDNI